jgi:hypothetical protein
VITSSAWRLRAAILPWLLLAGTAFGQIFPVRDISVTGPNDKRINIVFLSEGYTAGEMGKFATDIDVALLGLFATAPYKQYRSYFNVYAVEVPSNESGTDHPGTASDEPGGFEVLNRDTYFNSSFDVGGIHRLLVPEATPVFDVLENNFPSWDIAFVVVNQFWYGGSGGAFATLSTYSSSAEIGIHELGHAFAQLADEYETGGGGSGYEAPNATSQTNRDSIRWTDWIDLSTPIPTPETGAYAGVVGLFEGAVYTPTGWYRPKLFCKMRTLGVAFCEVCAEQSVKSMYNLLRLIDEAWPPTPGYMLHQDTTVNFWIHSPKPDPNTMSTTWYVDGLIWGSADTLPLDGSALDTGSHLLHVEVADTTHLVRDDSLGWLHDSMSWDLVVQPRPYVLGDADASGLVTAADIILLVNHVFKSGPPPFPWLASGDLNCDDVITSADIVRLVNFVFKSAPPPSCP